MKHLLIKHVFALATIAMLFAGCGKETPDDTGTGEKPEPPGPPIPTVENFDITISDIAATSAKAKIVPKEGKEEAYFTFKIFSEKTYNSEIGGTPEKFVEWLEKYIIEDAEFEKLKIPVYIEEYCNYGEATVSMTGLEPSVKHIFCFAEVNMEGKVVDSKPIICEYTTLDPSGNPPSLQVTLEPGDEDNIIVAKMYSDVTVAAKQVFFKADDVAQAISAGRTYRELVDESGQVVPAKYIADMNTSRGLAFTRFDAIPDTEYCFIGKAYSITGASIVDHVVRKSSGGAPEDPIAEYTAWLGAWTVTSTSSEINKRPITFDVTFTADINNRTFKVQGWSIAEERLNPELQAIAKFDYFKHGISFRNMQEALKVPGTGVWTITARLFDDETNQYAVTDITDDALLGSMNSGGASATVKGGLFWFQSGEVICTGIDFFMWTDDGYIRIPNPAPGFTLKDFPIGPYTMTKKAGPASMSPASYNNLTSPAFVMSAANKEHLISAKPKAKKLTPLAASNFADSKPGDNVKFTVSR